MSAILTALAWLSGKFFDALAQKAGELATKRLLNVEDRDGSRAGDREVLEKLERTLLSIEPIIGKVENLWIEDETLKTKVNDLFMQLKDAAYDAEDLLDDIANYNIPQQIEQQGDEASNLSSSSSSDPPRKKIKISFSSAARSIFGKGDGKDDDVIKAMKKTEERLDSIATEVEKTIAWVEESGRGKVLKLSTVSRKTSSFVVTQLFGRETELKELGGLLSKLEAGSCNSGSFSVVTIVGVGGVGKTTLVQEAYNNKLVGNCFDCKFWVCVSENFSEEQLTREMIESTTREKCDLMNFNTLQLTIKDIIFSKRFLLVLDDVWHLDSPKWERFCAPLRFGALGSKILITTRFKEIADKVGSVNPMNLDGLDENSFWQYFEKCIFVSQNFGDYPELEAIAKRNIHKLKGLPLAARTLGRLLNQSIDKRHWEAVLENKIWQLKQEETDILPALQLSYQCLPTHLKLCFAFCSLFPKDYLFKETDLILIWMAEGFIAPQENMRMEDIGSIYFRELVDRSFFQQSQYRGLYMGVYVIHDLLHDLAELISRGECYRIEGTKQHEIPNMIRHMSIFENRVQEFNGYNKLRTFMLRSNSVEPILLKTCHSMFERLKRINVLVLNSYGTNLLSEFHQLLPENIGNLVHLRYIEIKLFGFNRVKLPESLCNLFNLQSLILEDGDFEQRLPHGMSKLINLRHLVTSNETILRISEIGKLTALQKLPAFKVLNKHGHKIEELNHLTQLRGMLRIQHLENIASVEEARKGNLNNKKYLETLEFEWAPPCDTTKLGKHQLIVLQEILEALQPHQDLKHLTIKEYMGARSPSWLRANELCNLESVALVNCKRWEDLSYIVQLPHLKVLRIEGIPTIKQINHQLCGHGLLPKLEVIHLKDLLALEELPYIGQLPYLKVIHMNNLPALKYNPLCGPTEGSFFQMLKELVLEDLSALEELPDLRQLPCLRILRIKRMPSLKCICRPSYDSIERKSIPILEDLLLEDLSALEELPDLGQLPYLKVFCMKNIPTERYFGYSLCGPMEGKILPVLEKLALHDLLALEEIHNVGQLPCLISLSIGRIPKLKMIGHGFFGADEGKCFPCLKELILRDMPAWEEWSWPKDQDLFPCLETFRINECPKLKGLPPLPYSLEDLSLEDLSALEELPDLGQLPRLRILYITRMPSLKCIRCPSYVSIERKGFPILENLLLEDLSALEELPDLGRLPCLKVIHMKNIPAVRYFPCGHSLCGPTEGKIFPVLEKLVLHDLLALEEIHNLGQVPCLKSLSIERIPKLKMIGHGFFGADKGKCFPCLKELSIWDMPEWEEWSWPKDQDLFPSLRSFSLWSCPKLKGLPPLPYSLEKLSLSAVGLRELPRLCREIESNSSTITACLSSLSISACPNLTSLEEGLLMHHLPSIKSIQISQCKELMRLPVDTFKELTSLDVLEIRGCPKLMIQDEKFVFLPPSIKDLTLHGSCDLNKFQPSCPHSQISSLSKLWIADYPYLVFLPRLFPDLKKLERLRIVDCSELKSIEGLGNLESLESLTIRRCPRLLLDEGNKHKELLSSLIRLDIGDTTLLKQPSIRKTLPSIIELTISESSEVVVFEGEDQELLQSLTALEELRFMFCKNLQSLPTKLHTLSFLKSLLIIGCPQVKSLPETGLPTSLSNLNVSRNCHPTLWKQSQEYLKVHEDDGVKWFSLSNYYDSVKNLEI